MATVRRKLTSGPVTISLPGGDLIIEWTPGLSVRTSGSATHVYDGHIALEGLE